MSHRLIFSLCYAIYCWERIPCIIRHWVYPHDQQNRLNPSWAVVASKRTASSDSSARDEEPLVINPVNGLGSEVLMSRDLEGAGIHTIWGVRDGAIGPVATLIFGYIRSTRVFNATYSEMPPG